MIVKKTRRMFAARRQADIDRQFARLDIIGEIPVDDSDDDVPAVKTYDVILRVKPEKVGQIHSDTINGQKCLIIPMDENEHAAVNGVNTTI